MLRAKRGLAILALALASCTSPELMIPTIAVPTPLTLSATPLTAPLLNDLANAYRAAQPNRRYVFSINIQPVSNLLSSLENANNNAIYGLTGSLPEESTLWAAPVAVEQIAVIVHNSNPVTELSRAELNAIFQGRINNWQDVGGSQAVIEVISHVDTAEQRILFEALALGSPTTTQKAQMAFSDAAVIAAVSQSPGAIGYIAYSALNNSARTLAIDGVLPMLSRQTQPYPIRSTVFFAGPEEPAGEYRAFIAWAQRDGQRIVSNHYLTLNE